MAIKVRTPGEIMYRGIFWSLRNYLRHTGRTRSGQVNRTVKLDNKRELEVHITRAGNGWVLLRATLEKRRTFIYGEVRGMDVKFTVAGFPRGGKPRQEEVFITLQRAITEAYPDWGIPLPEWEPSR